MIELEASERAIATNEKMHSHGRGRADIAILARFDQRLNPVSPKWTRIATRARDGPSSSVFPPRVSLRAALHSRDTPRCTAAGHVIVVLASPRLDSRRGPREREELPRTGNRAKSNGEITLPHRFIEK